MTIEILENSKKGTVTINGNATIEGHVSDLACDICNSAIVYHDKYDAQFCPNCNHWLEKACSDADCCYCAGRPDNPLS
jgi:Zn finger protein HypA/HybF involved in hydrogenase expression